MLPEIVTEKDAKTYRAAMKSPQGVYFVTESNEKRAVTEQRKRLKQMNEELKGLENGDGSGVLGPEQTNRESVEPNRDGAS
jgi:hypothetical protein